jgi:hypothetical protein
VTGAGDWNCVAATNMLLFAVSMDNFRRGQQRFSIPAVVGKLVLV